MDAGSQPALHPPPVPPRGRWMPAAWSLAVIATIALVLGGCQALVGGCQALGGCQVGDKAVLAGHVTSVPLPLHSQLSVRVCERPATDCDRWSDLDSDGRFVVRDLEPTGYTVTVFLETPSGLVELSAVDVTLAGGQTSQIELDVPALPSIPPA